MTQRNKLQRLLNKLDGKSEATMRVIADFDAGAKALRDKLETDITATTLDEVNKKINALRKSVNINPLLEGVENLQKEFKQHALSTLKEIEDRTAELRTLISQTKNSTDEKLAPILKESGDTKKEIANLSKTTTETIAKVSKDMMVISDKLPSFADKKQVEEKLKELEEKDNTEELKDYTNKTRIELLTRIAEKGGGNMNRNILVGGNSSVLSKYTDVNLVPGTNVTLTYSNDETNRRVNLTVAATGGSGTSRTISTVTVSSVLVDTASTDIVVLANGGVQLTLPTAVSNTNLYTVKNIGTSSVLIGTTASQTVDGDSTIIMPVRYTAVDIISDNSNWHIT